MLDITSRDGVKYCQTLNVQPRRDGLTFEMYSTLIIRDCALSASQIPITVFLKASPSFPACSYDFNKDAPPVPDSWAARGVSAAQGTLEVSLLVRMSEDRMGIAYSAQVISATANDGSDITNTLPESVCQATALSQSHT